MATGSRLAVLGRVHEWIAAWGHDALSDGELLAAYVARRDVTAFAALMRRHGPLVFNICCGILRNEHDAEDAFQAVFLVLARKASSIRRHASLGGWLYKVAHHVALKARAAQRSNPQPPDAVAEDGDPAAALARRELCEALDEEMRRLPDKYRLPLVLCYLESLTTGEAARRLRWPVGTVKVRLMQAREMLRKRLERRGFALSLGGLVSLLTLRAAPATAGPILAEMMGRFATQLPASAGAAVGTATRAALLAEGSLLAMRAAQLKAALFGLLIAATLVAGGGTLLYRLTADRESAAAEPQSSAAAPSRGRVGTQRLTTPEAPLRLETPVVALTVAGDGTWIAAAGPDGRIRLWDWPSRRLRLELEAIHSKTLLREENAPEKRLWTNDLSLVSLGRDRLAVRIGNGSPGDSEVILWDAATGREQQRFAAGSTCCFSPSGEAFVTVQGEALVVRDLLTGRERRIENAVKDKPSALAVFADGRSLGLANGSGMIHLRELSSGGLRRSFSVPMPGPIPRPRDGLVFSPDGALVTLGGSWDGSLPLWATSTGALVRTLAIAEGLIHSVVFSADGALLAAATREESLRIVRTADGLTLDIIPRPHGEAGVTTTTFAPNSKTLFSAGTDGTVRCWPLP